MYLAIGMKIKVMASTAVRIDAVKYFDRPSAIRNTSVCAQKEREREREGKVRGELVEEASSDTSV